MRFVEIHDPTCSKKCIQFADMLLSRGIHNDRLFESIFIPIIINQEDNDTLTVRLFYRSLWSESYLRREGALAYPNINDYYQGDELDYYAIPEGYRVVLASVAECIQYIYQVTPPSFQKDVPDNIKSINSIMGLMHFFLLDKQEPAVKSYNVTSFASIFRMEMFDNNYQPDIKKFAFLRKQISKYNEEYFGKIIGIVEASSVPVVDIVNRNVISVKEEYIQMSFHADTEEDIELLYDLIVDNGFSLTGVACNDLGIFVSAYANKITDETALFVQTIYSQILPK